MREEVTTGQGVVHLTAHATIYAHAVTHSATHVGQEGSSVASLDDPQLNWLTSSLSGQSRNMPLSCDTPVSVECGDVGQEWQWNY